MEQPMAWVISYVAQRDGPTQLVNVVWTILLALDWVFKQVGLVCLSVQACNSLTHCPPNSSDEG